MPASTPTIYLVHDAADAAFAAAFAAALRTRVAAAAAAAGSPVPDVAEIGVLRDMPRADDIDALSIVLWVIPDPARPLDVEEKASLVRFRTTAASSAPETTRLLPVSPLPGRHMPPAPLDDLVSIGVHDVSDASVLDRVATRVLILMAMRVSGESQQLFISYRQRDGMTVARAIESGLEKRGFRIWRDDKPDRDGLPLISPGDPAQRTIHEALGRQSGVLVIDTPEAPNSTWVAEEVKTSLVFMLPVLPVVVDSATGATGAVPPIGGRFPSLELLGNEVRLAAGREVTDQTLDAIEREMTRLLLQQLSSRRRVVTDAALRFRAMGFTWREFKRQHLLFTAEAPRDSSDTPELRLRLLVQCAPYRRLLEDTLDVLCAQLRESRDPFQFGIIVHDAVAYQPQLRRLLAGRGGHVMALNADKLEALRRVIHINESAS